MVGAACMAYPDFYPRPFTRATDAHAADSERTYALFMHLAGLLGYIIMVPVVPTLVMWAIKKNESPYIDDHGREAMNAQISYLIYWLGCLALAPVTCGITAAGLGLLPIAALVFVILASINASKGQFHRYPITIRMIHS